MSYDDYEVYTPVVTTEKHQRLHKWPITSMRALVSGLSEMQNCTIKNRPAVFTQLEAAERELAEASAALEAGQAGSLAQSQDLEAAANRMIAANEALHTALQAADKARPAELNVRHNNRNFTLTWRAGSYQIGWTETETLHDGRRHRLDADSGAVNFVNGLTGAYTDADRRFKRAIKEEAQQYNLNSTELQQRLEQAIRLRSQWEVIDARNREKMLCEERAKMVQEKAAGLDMDCYVTELTDDPVDWMILTVESRDGGSGWSEW